MVELRTDNVKAVVFDWAGTTVDHGCRAPVKVFQAVFDSSGVPISEEEARGPMGLPKRDHLANLLSDSAIRARWRTKVGQDPGNDDVEVLYRRFLEMDRDIVTANSDVIPGVAKTVAALRARGIRIGSTTGYTRAVIQAILPKAAAQGYAPDTVVATDDVPAGRPSPIAMYKTFVDLAVWPASAVVKVDDTVPGIEEGKEAGCVTVGVTATGNSVGLSRAELEALPKDQRRVKLNAAEATLRAAGADFVIESVDQLGLLLGLPDSG